MRNCEPYGWMMVKMVNGAWVWGLMSKIPQIGRSLFVFYWSFLASIFSLPTLTHTHFPIPNGPQDESIQSYWVLLEAKGPSTGHGAPGGRSGTHSSRKLADQTHGRAQFRAQPAEFGTHFFSQKKWGIPQLILAAEITWCMGDLTCTYMHDVQTNSYAACVEYLSTHKEMKTPLLVNKSTIEHTVGRHWGCVMMSNVNPELRNPEWWIKRTQCTWKVLIWYQLIVTSHLKFLGLYLSIYIYIVLYSDV